jgi:hypothetical protein
MRGYAKLLVQGWFLDEIIDRRCAPSYYAEHKIDCIRIVIARSVSDEAISEMSF